MPPTWRPAAAAAAAASKVAAAAAARGGLGRRGRRRRSREIWAEATFSHYQAEDCGRAFSTAAKSLTLSVVSGGAGGEEREREPASQPRNRTRQRWGTVVQAVCGALWGRSRLIPRSEELRFGTPAWYRIDSLAIFKWQKNLGFSIP